jgi:hypothetical protein
MQSSKKNKGVQMIGILALTLLLCMAAPNISQASGTVNMCTEEALDAALSDGGNIVFQCSGIIDITQTKIIARDTTLDATGQNVTIRADGLKIFTVQPGVNFNVLNIILNVQEPLPSVSPNKGGPGGPTALPATGYPPVPPPPSEWLFVGLGGVLLILVSLIAGFLTDPRKNTK